MICSPAATAIKSQYIGAGAIHFSPPALSVRCMIWLAGSGNLPNCFDSGGSRSSIYATFLSELGRRPSITVFEDLHWADEATLDLLQFACRRVSQTHALMVLTYRDDEFSTHATRCALCWVTWPHRRSFTASSFSRFRAVRCRC